MGVWAMVRKPKNGTLHVLAPRQIQSARDGDHNDGGGLLLRGRGTAASYVYRYTAASGRRREMGLGLAHRGSLAQAGESLALARRAAHEVRGLSLIHISE